MNVLVEITTGSRLFGTATPTSDYDHRYVVLPDLKDLALGRVKHSVKLEDEVDGHAFSLQEFLRLAGEGQSIALEMLHAPLKSDLVCACTDTWRDLVVNRALFYTKAMSQMVGFATTMSRKYGARIERLNEVEAILANIDLSRPRSESLDSMRLIDIWDILPESPCAIKTINPMCSGPEKRVYQVCGREMQGMARVSHVYASIKAIADEYGLRVRAGRDGLIDYRSVHHAFRAGFQVKEILETGDLVFPLKDAAWLREVKLGHVDFFQNGLDKRLDDLIAEVSAKMAVSNLPDRVDQAWLDSIVLEAYNL